MRRFSPRCVCDVGTILLMFAFAHTLKAQATVQNAVLFGTVTDSSGAVLPGATVTATSPGLQGIQTATTDSSGNYRLPDLPIGVYKFAYTMTSFETVVRSGVILTAGFNLRLDIAMKPGATTQTVEVSEATAVIDTSTASEQATVESAVLQNIPTTRQLADAVYLIPGIRPGNTPDIGGSQLGNQLSIGAFGFSGNAMPMADGVDVEQAGSERGGATGGSQGQLINYDSIAVVQEISVGGEADIAEAGPVTIATTKSGSNQLHGAAHIFYEPHWFQATNLPASASGGGSASDQLQYFKDYEADAGFKLIKDRLWMWAGYHPEQNSYATYGYLAQVANGEALQAGSGQGYTLTNQQDVSTMVTAQLLKSLKFLAHYEFETQDRPTYGASPTQPYYDSTYCYCTNFQNYKGELIWTPTSRLVGDFLYGVKTNVFHYLQAIGSDIPGNPYTFDVTTGVTTGTKFNAGSSDTGAHSRKVITGSVSWFPSGKHSLQFGVQAFWPEFDTQNFYNITAGNYELETKNAGGVATGAVIPYEVLAYNFPTSLKGEQNAIGGYAKDNWRATKRLTVNFGVRFDYYNVFNPAETAPAGPFSLGASTPYLSVGTWSRFVPRVGAAYDVTGSGKTVIKGTYGMYGIPFIGLFDTSNFNPIGKADNVYDWSGDTCQATASSACTPSAAFLTAIQSSLANPSATMFNGKKIYVTTSATALSAINPSLTEPFVHQFSVEFQREVAQNFAVGANYVYQRIEDIYDQIYPCRPVTDYTLPYATTYPATDPVNGGKPLTVYTYPSTQMTVPSSVCPSETLVSANQTEFVNRTSNPDFYNAFGVYMTKRQVGKWGAGVSLDFIRDHQWIASGNTSSENPVAPYNEAFPLDESWDYTFKSYLTYNLPFRMTLGLNYMFLAGTPAYTTDQVSVPTSTINGTASASLGTITIPVNQYGSDRNPGQNLLNVRVGRITPIKDYGKLEVTLELFNALNSGVAESVNYLNGTGATAFGYQSTFMPPLIGRFGARYTF
jgi:hypothetical protein